jgi:methylated-DNA-protein-cysteine methyltransferase-like protein
MTYGSIAALVAPPPGMPIDSFQRIRARWVGYAMGRAPDGLPWQRVVGAGGSIRPRREGGVEVQKALLRSEGVRFDASGRVPLDRYGWSPPMSGTRLRRSRATRSSRRQRGG